MIFLSCWWFGSTSLTLLTLSEILNFGQAARFFRELTNYKFDVGSSRGQRPGSQWSTYSVNDALHGVYGGQATDPVLRRGDYQTPLRIFTQDSFDPNVDYEGSGARDDRLQYLRDFRLMFLLRPQSFDKGNKIKDYYPEYPFVTINRIYKRFQWLGLNDGSNTWRKPLGDNFSKKADKERPGPQLVVLNENVIDEAAALSAYDIAPTKDSVTFGPGSLIGQSQTNAEADANGSSRTFFRYVSPGVGTSTRAPLTITVSATVQNSAEVTISNGLKSSSSLAQKFNIGGTVERASARDLVLGGLSSNSSSKTSLSGAYERAWTTATESTESLTDKKTYNSEQKYQYTLDFSAYRPNADGLTIIDREAFLSAVETNGGVAPEVGRDQWSLESGQKYVASILVTKSSLVAPFSGYSLVSDKLNSDQPYIMPRSMFWNSNGNDELKKDEYDSMLRARNSAIEWVRTYLNYGGLQLAGLDSNEIPGVDQVSAHKMIDVDNSEQAAKIFNLASNRASLSYNITYDIQRAHDVSDISNGLQSLSSRALKLNGPGSGVGSLQSAYDLDLFGQDDMSDHVQASSSKDHIDGSEEGFDFVFTAEGADLLTNFRDSSLDSGAGRDVVKLVASYGNNNVSMGIGADTVNVVSTANRIDLGAGADKAKIKAAGNTLDLGLDQDFDAVQFRGLNAIDNSHLINVDVFSDQIIFANRKGGELAHSKQKRVVYELDSLLPGRIVLRDSLTGLQASLWTSELDWDLSNSQSLAAAVLMSAGKDGFDPDFKVRHLDSQNRAIGYLLSNSTKDMSSYEQLGYSLIDGDDRYANQLYRGLRSAINVGSLQDISRQKLKHIYAESKDVTTSASFDSPVDAADYFIGMVMAGLDFSSL